MDKKTTFHFVGSLIENFPELYENSQKMVSGNALTWINASIKVVDSIGNIVKLCLDKNNTKLLKNEIDCFGEAEENNKKKLEQEFLMKKLNEINVLRSDFENRRREIQRKYVIEKEDSYNQRREKWCAISNNMKDMRAGLKELFDIYDSKIDKIIEAGEFGTSEKRHMEECKRLLYQQFEKNIDI